jgi:hypothetical protein
MTVALGTSLVTGLIYLPLNGFQAGKWLGVVQFSVYFLFVVMAILQEADVLWPDVL